jgi:hypothetical protein
MPKTSLYETRGSESRTNIGRWLECSARGVSILKAAKVTGGGKTLAITLRSGLKLYGNIFRSLRHSLLAVAHLR